MRRALAVLALLTAIVAGACKGSSSAPTSAGCAAGTKACGSRCVPVADPLTGCGTAGACTPCPAGDPALHTVASCAAGACAIGCEAGWADCDGVPGNGCEVPLGASDPANCGVCGRACAGCVAGACPGAALPLAPPASYPRGIVSHGGRLYFVQAASDGLLRDAESGVAVASGLGTECDWAFSVPGADELLVTGQVPAPGTAAGYDLALFSVVDPSGAPTWEPAVVGTAVVYGEYLDGVVHDGTAALFSFSDRSGIWAWTGAPPAAPVADALAPRGLATQGGRTYFGTLEGDVRWVQRIAGVYQGGLVATSPVPATRLAVFSNPAYVPAPLLFWISDADGSVMRARIDGTGGVETVAPAASTPVPAANVDVTADGEGVYWSNWETGRVDMWRASDARVVPVGFSTHPRALAVRGTTVYWTDDAGGADARVYSAPIPLR